jgi:uncharacterized protein YdaT
MPWTYDDYPTSLKNLTAEVRRKAIDIANALLDDGYGDGRAIAIATAQAEKWAKRRHKQIAKKNTGGTTGQAVAPDTEKGDGEPIHVFKAQKTELYIHNQQGDLIEERDYA